MQAFWLLTDIYLGFSENGSDIVRDVLELCVKMQHRSWDQSGDQDGFCYLAIGGLKSCRLMQVDYSGFSTINTQRFGQHFVGKVANPNDVLLWQKSAARRAKVGALRFGFKDT